MSPNPSARLVTMLSDSLALDAERTARVRRGLETLASLNHPNLAAAAIEEIDGTAALVTFGVEGDDLAQLIARGPLPVDQVLSIAKQVAEGLEAAHERGIIHGGLKPASILVTRDGTVKVAGFGLAMAAAVPGAITGTPGYMSPEQAQGREVDKRADIWAFGAVTFEMLAGRRAFGGDGIAVSPESVLTLEPDWNALPASLPADLGRLLHKCLRKDAKARIRDIGDARQQIEELLGGLAEETPGPASAAVTASAAVPRRRTTLLAGVAVLMVVAIGAWLLTRPATESLKPTRFALAPTAQAMAVSSSERDLALSADGTYIVYVAGAGRQLMVRTIDALEAVPVRGITGAHSPFLSPDGRWIGFFTGTDGELRKVAIEGGAPVTLCPIVGAPRGAAWGPDDSIIFATTDPRTGLLRVAADGGAPSVLTSPDVAKGEADHFLPSLLPNGRAVLMTVTATSGGLDAAQVHHRDLSSGQSTTLVRGGSQAEFVAPGYLVYAAAGTLRAALFDPGRRTVSSDPVPVVDGVTTLQSGAAEYSVSRTGALVYVPGGATIGGERSLIWVTRDGQESPVEGAPPRRYQSLRLSPDGARVALEIRDQQQQDLWTWDLTNQALSRLTDAPGADAFPVWTPDSKQVVFASTRAGVFNIFLQPGVGTSGAQRLTTSPNFQVPLSISPDGSRLVVRETVPTTGFDLRILGLEPRTGPTASARTSEPIVATKSTEDSGEISPDGRWLAYQSNVSGRNQVFVRPFPSGAAGPWTISPNAGTMPLWGRSGKDLYYLDAAGAMTRVPIETTPAFRAGAPTTLFAARYYTGGAGGRTYDVSPDGQRFLMIKNRIGTDEAASMVVVLNWQEELRAKLSAR